MVTSARRPTKKAKINVTQLAKEIQQLKGLPEPPTVEWEPGVEISVGASLTDEELKNLLASHSANPRNSLVPWKSRLLDLLEKQEDGGLNEQERRERNDLMGKALLMDLRGLLDES